MEAGNEREGGWEGLVPIILSGECSYGIGSHGNSSISVCVCGWTVTWTVWILAEAKMNHGALKICQNLDTILSTSALFISLTTHTFQVYLPYSRFTLCIVLGISQGKKTNSLSLESSFGSFRSERKGFRHRGAVWLYCFIRRPWLTI